MLREYILLFLYFTAIVKFLVLLIKIKNNYIDKKNKGKTNTDIMGEILTMISLVFVFSPLTINDNNAIYFDIFGRLSMGVFAADFLLTISERRKENSISDESSDFTQHFESGAELLQFANRLFLAYYIIQFGNILSENQEISTEIQILLFSSSILFSFFNIAELVKK